MLIVASMGLSLMVSGLLFARIIAAQVSVADVLTVAESVQESVHTSVNIVVTDVLSISESVQESVSSSVNAQVADVLRLSDFILVSVGTRNSSAASVIESLRSSVAINASQVSSIGDSINAGLASSRSDPVGLAESVTFLVQQSDGGEDDGAGDASPSDDDDGGDGGTITVGADLPGDLDGDQIGNEIDGRFVGGQFVDERNIFSANFTDQHLGGSTFGPISTRGGLNVALSDASNPDIGLQVSVSGQGGNAVLLLCDEQFNVNLTAGDTTLLTCGSLTVTVLTGQVEVDLKQDLSVTIDAGATAKVNSLGNSRFVAENSGTSGLVAAINNGNRVEIAPGERVEIEESSEPGPLSTPEPLLVPTPASASTPVPSRPGPTVETAPGIIPEPHETPAPAQTPDAVVAAPAPSVTPPVALTGTPSPEVDSPPTPLPQPTATFESEREQQSFPPLLDEGLSARTIGGIVLGAIAGTAFIAVVVALIGLVRHWRPRDASTTDDGG